MFEVKIYGEIVGEYAELPEDGYATLSRLQSQLANARGKPLLVRINSIGGDVSTGFEMYNELRRYAQKWKVNIRTFGEGNVSSIATVVFLAGDERVLTEYTSPFVHNAWTYAEGNSKQLIKVAQDLKLWSTKIAKHYETHTDLTYQEALAFMNAEAYISPDEALAMRFATEIETVLRPKALQRFENKKNKNLKTDVKMKKNTKGFSVIAAALKALMGVSAKMITLADETELNFPDLADDAVIAVGDVAEDAAGDPAQGDYVLSTGETYTFEAGVLTDILPADGGSDAVDVVALQEENKNLIETLEALTAAVAKKDNTINALKLAVSKKPAASEKDNTAGKPNTGAKAKGNRSSEAIAGALAATNKK